MACQLLVGAVEPIHDHCRGKQLLALINAFKNVVDDISSSLVYKKMKDAFVLIFNFPYLCNLHTSGGGDNV